MIARATWMAPEMSAAAPERMIRSALARSWSVRRMVVGLVSGNVVAARLCVLGGWADDPLVLPPHRHSASPAVSPEALRGVGDWLGVPGRHVVAAVDGDAALAGLEAEHFVTVHRLCIPQRHTGVKRSYPQ